MDGGLDGLYQTSGRQTAGQQEGRHQGNVDWRAVAAPAAVALVHVAPAVLQDGLDVGGNKHAYKMCLLEIHGVQYSTGEIIVKGEMAGESVIEIVRKNTESFTGYRMGLYWQYNFGGVSTGRRPRS